MTECNSPDGITIGLIDGIISMSRVLEDRDWSSDEVQSAIKDIRATDAMHRLMDIGDLQSAKDYIESQKKDIKALLIVNELKDKFGNQTLAITFNSYLDTEIGLAISRENGSRADALIEAKEKFSQLINNP